MPPLHQGHGHDHGSRRFCSEFTSGISDLHLHLQGTEEPVLCVLWLPAILLSWFLCMHMLHGSSIFWWQPARLPRASPEDPPTITNHGPEIIFLNRVTKMETQNEYRDRGTSLTMFNTRLPWLDTLIMTEMSLRTGEVEATGV